MELLDSFRHQFEADLANHLRKILAEKLPIAPELQQAIRYSLCAGGKRVRALLCLTGCAGFGGDRNSATIIALAIEYLHAYSLIHDDLPAMDNDDIRRGLPTNHKRFGEDMAILAGDALQALSFATLQQLPETLVHRKQIIAIVTNASLAMVSGQALDIRNATTCQNLEQMHKLKTGALISTSLVSGCLCSNHMYACQLTLVESIGEKLGIAFQIADDLLEYQDESIDLGKPSTSDKRNAKITYPMLFGVDHAKSQVQQYHQQARAYIDQLVNNHTSLGDMSGLISVCNYLSQRKT